MICDQPGFVPLEACRMVEAFREARQNSDRRVSLRSTILRSVICPTGKSASFLSVVCPDPARKIFRFARRANHLYQLAPSRLDKRGRFAIVTDVECGMRWTWIALLTNGANADGEVV